MPTSSRPGRQKSAPHRTSSRFGKRGRAAGKVTRAALVPASVGDASARVKPAQADLQ
ncbi:hypothetical protein C7S14_2068 [Burkholderia cepacia]|nr:hypothetical protein C7S14_2068 [Burkholderia cepacia]